MRTLLLFLVPVLACSHSTTASRASPSVDPAGVAAIIAQYDQRFISADSAGDKAALGELLSDDFQQLWPSGDTVGKQTIIGSLKPNPPGMTESLRDVRVQVDDPVAISRGQWLTSGAPPDSRTSPVVLYSNVWLRQGARWRLIASVIMPQEEHR